MNRTTSAAGLVSEACQANLMQGMAGYLPLVRGLNRQSYCLRARPLAARRPLSVSRIPRAAVLQRSGRPWDRALPQPPLPILVNKVGEDYAETAAV